MQVLLLVAIVLLFQAPIYRAIPYIREGPRSEKLQHTVKSSLFGFRRSFSATFWKTWGFREIGRFGTPERDHSNTTASKWHFFRPYKRRPRKDGGVDASANHGMESSLPQVSLQNFGSKTTTPDPEIVPDGFSTAVPPQVLSEALLSESNELIHDDASDIDKSSIFPDVTASLLPQPQYEDGMTKPYASLQANGLDSIPLVSNLYENREDQSLSPRGLPMDIVESHSIVPLEVSSGSEPPSPSPPIEVLQGHATISTEEPSLLPIQTVMNATPKPTSVMSPSSMEIRRTPSNQPILESPEATAVAESNVLKPIAPENSHAFAPYPALTLDEVETVALDSSSDVNYNLCLYSDCKNEFQTTLLFDLKGGNTLTESTETVSRRDGVSSSGSQLAGLHIQHVLVVQICVWSRQYDSIADVSAPRRTTVYAFRSDPHAPKPEIIAASNTDPKGDVQSRCEEVLRLEIPVSVGSRTFVMLSRPKSLHPALANVSSSLSSSTRLKANTTGWNVEALSAARKILNDSEELAHALNRVYILSSAPYLQHSELEGVAFDTAGLRTTTEPLSANENADPFCDPTGTEIAAAVAGKTLGLRYSVGTTLVPVSIRSCLQPATEDSVLRGLLWVYGHMLQRSKGFTIVVTEQFSQQLLGSEAVSKVLTQLREGGSFVFVPVSFCLTSTRSYLSIGAYGQGSNNLPEVEIENKTCASRFDLFAPGLRVAGISTIGPYAYRNISRAPHIAAAGIAALVAGILPQVRQDFDASDLNDAVKKHLSLSAPVVLKEHVEKAYLPVLGTRTLPAFLHALLEEYGSSKDIQENKAASSLIPNFPNGALIGVCAVAGALIVAMVAGAIVAVRRNTTDASDFSYIMAQPSTPDDEDGYLQEKPKREANNPSPIRSEEDHAGRAPHSPVAQQSVDLDRTTPTRRNRSTHNPLAEIGRLLSISKNKASPATPNAKASWFATPKGPIQQVFSGEVRPNNETISKPSGSERNSESDLEMPMQGELSVETKQTRTAE